MSSVDGSPLSRLVLLIGFPGAAYEAVGEVLASHPDVQSIADAHALTPLAHLGYYDKVYKAPYDHVLAAEAQRLFVEQLPRGEADYVDACRAYCEGLYGRALEASGKALFLDATHDYTRILPFLRRVLPDAKYVIVTRHPLASLSDASGDPAAADRLREYVHAIGAFSGRPEVTYQRVRYEDFAVDPRATVDALCAYLGRPADDAMYREAELRAGQAPADAAWAHEYATDAKLAEAQHLLRGLAPEELAAYGYSPDDLWRPVEAVLGRSVPHAQPPAHLQWQRSAVDVLGRAARKDGLLNRVVRKTKLACDVLLREQ